jgi:uracil phosphoribosyltransferase
VYKQKTLFLQKYYKEMPGKKQEGSLIITNESLMVPSKYQAVCDLLMKEEHLELNITTFGLWGCNIGSNKLAELFETINASSKVKLR